MAVRKEIEIVADVSQAKSEVDKLNNSLEDVSKEGKKASTSIDDVGSNGGAIAILDSLTGGLATRLRDAYEASKLFNVSLKATRGALIATGIGALVVSLGLVVAYWDDIKMFITGSNGELEKQLDLINDENAILDRNLKTISDTENTLRLQGLSQQEINKLKQDELKAIVAARGEELKLLNVRLDAIKEQEKAGIGSVERIFRITQRNAKALGVALDVVLSKLGLNTEFGENIDQAAESALESLFGTEADKKAVQERINNITDQINAAQNQLDGFELEAQESLRKRQEEIDKRPNVSSVGGLSSKGFDNISEDPEVIFAQEKAERLAEIDKGLTDILIENAKRELAQKERVAQLKVDLEENTFALLGNLAEEGSKLSKGVAIANVIREQVQGVSAIISNTAVANAKAAAASPLTAGQPFVTLNTVAAGLGIAGSIAGAVSAIKDINSEKKSVSGGGVNFGGAGGGGQVDAPSFNLVQGSGTNQISDSINGQNRPVQAYVVSNEVTSAQELDRNIQNDASLT